MSKNYFHIYKQTASATIYLIFPSIVATARTLNWTELNYNRYLSHDEYTPISRHI